MVGYILYAQVLFYLWQMLALILGIATGMLILYGVVGLLLLKRAREARYHAIEQRMTLPVRVVRVERPRHLELVS